MKKKWYLAIFVFAFTFSLSAFGFADTVNNNGSCADSVTDGYELCHVNFHVGDNKSGGYDDYDFDWVVSWDAVDYNTAHFSQGNYYASGVASGNDDYISSVEFTGSTTTKFYNCSPDKLRSMTSGVPCFDYYGKSINENSSTSNIKGTVRIYDPENVRYFNVSAYFKPTS